MKCRYCGNPAEPCNANKNKLVWGFTIQLRSSFDIYSNVPCFMRSVVNHVLGNFMRVKTPEDEFYQYDVDKLKYKTRIYGDHYNEFLEEYNMEPSDIIVFEFEPEKDYVHMYPQDQYGNPKEKDAPSVYVFDESAKAIVISKGVKPKPSEVENINHAVMMHGLGQGAIFIQRLTNTDVNHNGLRIPKHLVSVIDVPRSGTSYLVFGNEENMTQANYGQTADRRIRFKDGWPEFALGHNLNPGMLVLIMFHKMDDDNLQESSVG